MTHTCALHKQGQCSGPEGTAASQAGPAPSLWVSQSLALFISSCFNFSLFLGLKVELQAYTRQANALRPSSTAVLLPLPSDSIGTAFVAFPKVGLHAPALLLVKHLPALKLFLVLKPHVVANSPLALTAGPELYKTNTYLLQSANIHLTPKERL